MTKHQAFAIGIAREHGGGVAWAGRNWDRAGGRVVAHLPAPVLISLVKNGWAEQVVTDQGYAVRVTATGIRAVDER